MLLLIRHNLHILKDVLCKQLETLSDPCHDSVHLGLPILSCLHYEEGVIFTWCDHWWLQRPSHVQHH